MCCDGTVHELIDGRAGYGDEYADADACTLSLLCCSGRICDGLMDMQMQLTLQVCMQVLQM